MSDKRNWRMFLAPIAVAVLWALWSAWWAYAYYGVQRIHASEARRLAREGIELQCAKLDWGGYPFRIEATCAEPRLTVAQGASELNASAARLAVVIQAYNLRHAIALIDGPSDIEGDRFAPIHVEHGRAVFSLRVGANDDFRFGAEIPTLVVDGRYTAERLLMNVTGGPDADAKVALAAETAVLPVTRLMPLKLTSATTEATVPKALLRPDGLAGASEPENHVKLERLALTQGPLTIAGKGTVGLDPERRPQGKLATIVSDLTLLMEEAKSVFGLNDSDAKTATTMIALLNAGKTVNVPVELGLKAGAIYWGAIKIAEVPQLAVALAP